MIKQNKQTEAQGAKLTQKNLGEKIQEALEGKRDVSHETNDEPAMFDGGQAEVTEMTFQQLGNAFIEDMVETDEVKKKERKPNTIYTLKAFREHINKLATHKVCTAEEVTQLRKIHKAATERWIGLTME